MGVLGLPAPGFGLLLLGCAMQASSEGPLELVQRLTVEPEHDRAAIERVLAAPLAEVDAANPYYAVFAGEPDEPAWLSKVDLRQSREGERSLLIMTLTASSWCVTPREVVAEYGEPHDVTRPSPSEAAGLAEEDGGVVTYYGYTRAGDKLGFGFRAAGAATCLGSVTISRDGCLEVRIPSSAQAQFGGDVRIGAGNIWEGAYENSAGESVRGLSAGLSVFVRGRPESTLRLRVGPGSRFEAGGESFEVREVRPDGVTLCRRAPPR